MTVRTIRLPDVGEGVAEAEVVEWHVKIGDLVQEDATIAAVMTDKATVEIPSPVAGKIVWLAADVGNVVAVGADLVRLEINSEDIASDIEDAKIAKPDTRPTPYPDKVPSGHPAKPLMEDPSRDIPTSAQIPRLVIDTPAQAGPFRRFAGGAPRPEGEKPLASPAVRLRAREGGADLRQVPGSGPAGRITHEDLDTFFARGQGSPTAPGLQPRTAVEDIKIIGLRRRIAEKMAIAHEHIPHITYVEEIDVTALEELRTTLNKNKRQDQPRLTLLPFLMRSMVKAVAEQPGLNALFDDQAGILRQHAGVHIGIAAQTATGLVVPVVRHAEALDLWACGAKVNRLVDAAKKGTASRDELSGSTITITSLGAMGGVVTTPIINYPEVAIIGVNKITMRPVWDGSAFIPRKMMNLSSSFDHRVVDGFNAAQFVQRIKALLEAPALIFMEG